MLKLFITAIDSREDGTAVILFEDYQVNYEDDLLLGVDDQLGYRLAKKIQTIEAINEQASSPL